MRNTVILFWAFIVLLFTSCETDFDVTAEWEDITIVYGLLNQNDSIHHVKINKAFLGDGNLLEYASIEDSSTYQTKLNVQLEEIDGNQVNRTFELDTTTITNKEEGVFYHPEQIIYTTGENNKVWLNENYEYRIKIENPETGKIITAETPLVKDFDINKPLLNSTFRPTLHFPLNDFNREVSWTTSENGKLYQLVVQFDFIEVNQQGDSSLRNIRWERFPDSRSNSSDGDESMQKFFANNEFYEFVEDKVPYKDAERESQVQKRYSDKLDFEITVASEDFDTYIEVNKPSNSLIEYTPDFSNVENGIGLFSSRYQKVRTFYLQKATRINLSQLEAKFVDPDSE
ncbi:MAG: hypothetical protein ACQESX_09305 [Bacteroidota bacterium]